jgi:hypothetical protein
MSTPNFSNNSDRFEITEKDRLEGFEHWLLVDKENRVIQQAMDKADGLIVLQRIHTLKDGRRVHKVVDTGSLEIDGVDGRDAPDFSDAYFSAGQFKDGTDMTDEELNELAAEHPDLLYEKIYHYASD